MITRKEFLGLQQGDQLVEKNGKVWEVLQRRPNAKLIEAGKVVSVPCVMVRTMPGTEMRIGLVSRAGRDVILNLDSDLVFKGAAKGLNEEGAKAVLKSAA